jgi:phosphate-selective porin
VNATSINKIQTIMKLNTLTKLSALSLSLFSASALTASDDALLDLLVKKGVLSSTEATEVAAELKDASGFSFSAKGKETIKLRFNGRMHYQYDSLNTEDNGGSGALVDKPSSNHFYFRRLRVGFKATHKNGLYADTVLNFTDGSFSLSDGIAGYKYSDALDVGLGYKKVPFGFQETYSSSKIKTIERSATNRFFADDIQFSGGHTGIHFSGKLDGGFSYAAAVVNGAAGEGSKLGGGNPESSNDMAAFGRVRFQISGLTLGLDAGQASNLLLKSGKETLTAPAGGGTVTSSTSADTVEDVTAYTTYANYKMAGLDLLAEYFSADMGDQGDSDGYAIRVAYKNGKFEPVFRYSYLENEKFEIDTDNLIRRAPAGAGVSGANGELTSYYVGLNYYPSKATSFMVGYEMAEAESDSGDKNEIDGLRARLQVLW